jgi:MoxR-like ATPase
VRCAKALALIESRDHVLPSDISRLAVAVMAHRLVLKSAGGDSKKVVNEIIERTSVPPGDLRP